MSLFETRNLFQDLVEIFGADERARDVASVTSRLMIVHYDLMVPEGVQRDDAWEIIDDTLLFDFDAVELTDAVWLIPDDELDDVREVYEFLRDQTDGLLLEGDRFGFHYPESDGRVQTHFVYVDEGKSHLPAFPGGSF